MSSFIGHTLVSITIAALPDPQPQVQAPAPAKWLWPAWLLVLGVAPDVDYFVPALQTLKHAGLRVTHAILPCIALPLLTVAVLAALGVRGRRLRTMGLQALAANLAHLLLDTLVGVWAFPLLWPLSTQTFRLPFGVLSSAAHFHLANPYLYINTLIELGVLGPACGLAYRHTRRSSTPRHPLPAALALLALVGFTFWAYTLER